MIRSTLKIKKAHTSSGKPLKTISYFGFFTFCFFFLRGSLTLCFFRLFDFGNGCMPKTSKLDLLEDLLEDLRFIVPFVLLQLDLLFVAPLQDLDLSLFGDLDLLIKILYPPHPHNNSN